MKADAMNLSTIPKRYLISAITQRFSKPIVQEGSKHLQDEGACDVPFPKREREEKEREKKVRDISKMKENVAKTQESQKSAERLSWEKPPGYQTAKSIKNLL